MDLRQGWSELLNHPASVTYDRYIRTHNANSQPFVWTATADSILQKLARLCQRITAGTDKTSIDLRFQEFIAFERAITYAPAAAFSGSR